MEVSCQDQIAAIFQAAASAGAGQPGRPAKKAKKRQVKAKPNPKTKLKKRHKKPILYDPATFPPSNTSPVQPLKAFVFHPYQFVILPLRLFHWTIGFQLMNQDPSIRACWEARKVPKGSPESVKVYARAIVKMLKHRQLFRRFLHRWRTSRLRVLNTVDCITLEPIKKPIQIVDWISEKKTIVLFEAQTLLKDITERLMFHDGFFEDPQLPRNPMTNLPLTQAQMLSVWDQISRAGIPVSSAFVLFRKARWNLDTYLVENETFLKLHAFRATMKDIGHIDTQDRMLDFIQYCYELESVDCSIPAFKYALAYFPEHKTIREWQSLCKEFYEAHILYTRQPQKLEEHKNRVLDKTDALLDKQGELMRLRISDMRVRRQALQAQREEENRMPPLIDPVVAQQLELLSAGLGAAMGVQGVEVEFVNMPGGAAGEVGAARDIVPGSAIPMDQAANTIAALLNSLFLTNENTSPNP
jgi:hypothetical protein